MMLAIILYSTLIYAFSPTVIRWLITKDRVNNRVDYGVVGFIWVVSPLSMPIMALGWIISIIGKVIYHKGSLQGQSNKE